MSDTLEFDSFRGRDFGPLATFQSFGTRKQYAASLCGVEAVRSDPEDRNAASIQMRASYEAKVQERIALARKGRLRAAWLWLTDREKTKPIPFPVLPKWIDDPSDSATLLWGEASRHEMVCRPATSLRCKRFATNILWPGTVLITKLVIGAYELKLPSSLDACDFFARPDNLENVTLSPADCVTLVWTYTGEIPEGFAKYETFRVDFTLFGEPLDENP